jgi:hypothetical protein
MQLKFWIPVPTKCVFKLDSFKNRASSSSNSSSLGMPFESSRVGLFDKFGSTRARVRLLHFWMCDQSGV